MSEQLKSLRKKKELLLSKRDYLRDRLNNYRNLEHRSKCPYCEQDIDYEQYRNRIPEIEEKLNRTYNKIEHILEEVDKLEKPIMEERRKEYKQKQERIREYLKNNRNRLNKAIRDYNNGLKDYLPKEITTKEEKELWNESMQIQLDNKGKDENEELEFEI